VTLATVTMALGEDEVQLDQREQASVMQVSVSRAAAHPEGPQECQRAPPMHRSPRPEMEMRFEDRGRINYLLN
jgi:hypothetical protein